MTFRLQLEARRAVEDPYVAALCAPSSSCIRLFRSIYPYHRHTPCNAFPFCIYIRKIVKSRHSIGEGLYDQRHSPGDISVLCSPLIAPYFQMYATTRNVICFFDHLLTSNPRIPPWTPRYECQITKYNVRYQGYHPVCSN